MERTIKFRCWDYCAAGFIDNGEGLPIYECGWDGEVEYQQFTGLEDLNGKEIYEGDILKISNVGKFVPDLIDETWKDGEEYVVKIVRSRMGEYYGQNTKTSWFTLLAYKNWEIIGNIFENPELLNQ